jgi:ubiquinone/menaquinone biosynthesis C-methylase UbiE
MNMSESLDIGCGYPNPSEPYEKRGTINIDIKHGFADVLADAHRLPFRGAIFDQVLIYSALEHFYNPDAVLHEAKRVAKLGAKLTMTTVNANFWPFALNKSSPEHLYTWDVFTLTTLVERAGFKILARSHFTFKKRPSSMRVRLMETCIRVLYGRRAERLLNDCIKIDGVSA